MICSLVSIYFDSPQVGLGLVSPPRFVYEFSKKIFLVLYSIN